MANTYLILRIKYRIAPTELRFFQSFFYKHRTPNGVIKEISNYELSKKFQTMSYQRNFKLTEAFRNLFSEFFSSK